MIIKETFTNEELKMLEQLENSYYGNDFVVGGDDAEAWNDLFPFQQVAAVIDGQIVGFLEMFPVRDSLVEGYLTGELSEQDIDICHMVDIYNEPPGTYAMLICTTLIDEKYRGQGILRKLFENRFAFYEKFEEKGFVFDKTIADTVSTHGSGFVEKIGMQLKTETSFGTKIYMGVYSELKEKFSSI
jgi:GNAT superfamily N-acetyltransferase